MDEIVIDCSFFHEMKSDEDWISQPEFFRPLLEEAKS